MIVMLEWLVKCFLCSLLKDCSPKLNAQSSGEKNDLFNSYSNMGGSNDLHFLYQMVSWNGLSIAASQLLEGGFTRNKYIKLVAMKLFIMEDGLGWYLLGSNQLLEKPGWPGWPQESQSWPRESPSWHKLLPSESQLALSQVVLSTGWHFPTWE